MKPGTPGTESAPSDDPFKYGWRFVKREQPDGSVELERVPLTLRDTLHPREEDVIPVRPIHELDCRYLADIFDSRSLTPKPGWIAVDWNVDWEVSGLEPVRPDLAVFVGLKKEPNLQAGTLKRSELGGQCRLVIEVVSPNTRNNDVEIKVDYYYQVGVPLYVIIDQEGEEGPRSLVAYQHTPGGYDEVPLDEEGRIYLPPLNLFLTLREGRAACIDAATGRELGDYTQMVRDLEEADRRQQEQERAMEEAVLARQNAERAARDEQKAREDAEHKARDEQKAREDAEHKARDEQKAREDAERKARDEQKAREDAEQKAAEAARTAKAEQEALRQRILELERRLGLPPEAPLSGASEPTP